MPDILDTGGYFIDEQALNSDEQAKFQLWAFIYKLQHLV